MDPHWIDGLPAPGRLDPQRNSGAIFPQKTCAALIQNFWRFIKYLDLSMGFSEGNINWMKFPNLYLFSSACQFPLFSPREASICESPVRAIMWFINCGG
jgi:hypothetical protein